MSKKKYRPGKVIDTFNALFVNLKKTGFVYARHKIYHEGWVISWNLKYVKSLIDGGHIKRAIKIKEATK